MWNDINTGRVLILTLSKVKLTLMILLCSRALAVLINATGERARGMVCVCTCKGVHCMCCCVRLELCPSTHTWRQSYSTNIQQRLCESFFSVLCVTPLTVATEQRLVSGSSPSVNKVCLHRHLPWPAQHGSAWHSRTWQRCWALKVSMPLHESRDTPSCKSGFSLCIAGSHQWGIELHPRFCLPASVAVHPIKPAVWSSSAASQHSTLFMYFYISKPKLISAHISCLHVTS